MPKILRPILRSANRLLYAFLLAYWVIFIAYSALKLCTGGIKELLAGYEHIALEGSNLNRMKWSRFILNQAALLTATIVTGIITVSRKAPER